MGANGDITDFGARVYDSELPMFLSPDPAEKEFPYQSSYVFAGNTPIQAIDENGTKKRVVHLFNVEFDKGDYHITQLPDYKRQDGEWPEHTYGTDEIQYHFNGNFYNDIYKIPGYQFFIDQQTKPVTDKLKLVGQLGVDVLSVWLAMRGTTKNNSSWGRAILATFGLSTTVWQLNLHINELLNGEKMEGVGNNLGGHLGMTIDFIAKGSLIDDEEVISVEGIFEIVDDIVVWKPTEFPESLPDAVDYGISVYNLLSKSQADDITKKVKEKGNKQKNGQ